MKITYIIQTSEGEYYCGKTNDIKRRFKEHMNEIRPSWFGFKKRKLCKIILEINGDYEKMIKKAGVKAYYESVINASTS